MMVKRYDMEYGVNKYFSREAQVQPVQSAQGAWVSFEDYAVLAAQVEELQQFCLTAAEVQEIRAESGRDGFIACHELDKIVPVNDESVQILADGYADKIRRGEEHAKT